MNTELQLDGSDWEMLFTGRGKELQSLHSHLTANVPVLLFGPRGIGKTALCVAYCNLFASYYAATIRISASMFSKLGDMDDLVRQELRRTAHLDLRSSSSIPYLVAQASTAAGGKPVLFVVDDLDSVPRETTVRVADFFLRFRDRSRLILSGIRPEDYQATLPRMIPSARWSSLHLSPFTRAEIREVLEKRLKLAGLAPSLADEFFARLSQLGADWGQLSPRFVLHLLDSYLKTGTIDAALSVLLHDYFETVTQFVLTSTDTGIRMLPIGRLAQSKIVIPTSEHLTVLPLVVIPNFSRFWRLVLEEFEALINNPRTREVEIQAFFEKHPQLLKGIDYERVVAHPVLERDDDGNLIPDFFLKPRTSDFVDVLDLKLPSKKLITGRKDRKALSGSVTEAIAQLREYRDFFERQDYRERVRRNYGVTGYRPNTIVVIGRDPRNLPEEQVRQIMSDTPGHLRIVTYDTLFARMRAMAEQNYL